MKVNNTELIVKASLLEDGLVEDVVKMIEDNHRLFDNEKVVLMADAHKGIGVPVGFTMTLSKGLVPVDYVSADMFCGVTSMIIHGYTPSKYTLESLSKIARDILPVNARVGSDGNITSLGTLGNGNHFIEIGVDGDDTMISVHSGSRSLGGKLFKKHKTIATQHTNEFYAEERSAVLKTIEPKLRSEYLKSLPKKSGLSLLDTKKYPLYWQELEEARQFAQNSRQTLLDAVALALVGKDRPLSYTTITSVHNYIDTNADTPVLRKGSIQANDGDMVVIPINMRDGIIVGKVKTTEQVNYSLPHGAGRVMSRTKAFETLDLEQFKDDMKSIVSPTVIQSTLDESPRAYKPIEIVLEDIKPFLSEYRIFKPVFSYKGVE